MKVETDIIVYITVRSIVEAVIMYDKTFKTDFILMLKLLGADVRPIPVVPWTDPNNYNHQV
jgi:cysteine synthase A